MTELLFYGSSFALVLTLIGGWWVESRAHNRRLAGLGLRIHVNGIRGKSTVTRLIAGALREAGVATIGKSTGSAAAVIGLDGEDTPIFRRGPATILEQIDIVRHNVRPDTQAIVIECMALRPNYQAISEAMIVRSNIGIITNVREDHQDVMGETLPEIAESLLSTCPTNGALITAEQDPGLQQQMQDEAKRRGSSFLVADPTWVTDEEIARFDYVSFKDNIAIALAVALLLGIPRETALTGMVKAAPDPGVLRLTDLTILGKKVTWANLFAVNDRESAIIGVNLVMQQRTDETTTVCILNNRSDRERRAMQFADITTNDLQFDYLATFGAYEGIVTSRLVKNGHAEERIIRVGDGEPDLDAILRQIVGDVPGEHILLVGLVNIHTAQADALLAYLEPSSRGAPLDESYPD